MKKLLSQWRAVYRAPIGLFRRSLMARVVTTALTIGIVVVIALSFVLVYQIRNGLFNERLNEALNEAGQLTTAAQADFDSSSATSPVGAQNQVEEALLSLQTSAVAVILMRTPQSGPGALSDLATDSTMQPVISTDLRDAVAKSSHAEWQSVTLPQSPHQPGLIIGSRVEILSGEYGLYFVYDLSSQQQTLSYVEEVLAIGGLIIVLAIGGLTWLAVRQAVVPLRSAARVAEDLSHADLGERMEVRGQTEMASLAVAFNDMAGSLQEQIEQMEHLSQAQRRFVSDVSHELRTPLTTIRMAGEVLYESRGDFSADLARTTELLSDQLDRFDALLADLLEISRIDAGAAVVERVPRDVRDVVAQALDVSQPLAASKNVELTRLFSARPCVADIDSRRIARIVRNLVVNAIEHGEAKPVDIHVAANDNAVAVVVRDRGVGMTGEELTHVFDRFWRADPSRARTTGGTGLGLAISLEDAQLHGGRLDVAGSPGAGASFRLVIPVHEGMSASPSPLLLDGSTP